MTSLKKNDLQRVLDAVVLVAFGCLLIKYTLLGQLRLLIHPNYTGLVWATSIILLVLGSLKVMELRRKSKQTAELQHATLIPPIVSSLILLVTVILGFFISPQVLTSQTALARGVSESSLMTRTQPELFRTFSKPESRSLLDWVRTINAYPEPEAYRGQVAKISGFVVHSPQLPNNYLLLSRFVITCCAVDAYPVGIPVKLNITQTTYPSDSWLSIEGQMEPDNLNDRRQLVLVPKSIKTIPTPSDPYNFSGT